jgi:hypothetical protein
MTDDSDNRVRVREFDWAQLVRDKWGKDWTKPEPAYEFSGGRTMDDNPRGGPYSEDQA